MSNRDHASAGSAPAASLKRVARLCVLTGVGRLRRIRGVCPRGLIEAEGCCAIVTDDVPVMRIRGVCPRGLIEASCRTDPTQLSADSGGIRGVCPRGLIEAPCLRRDGRTIRALSRRIRGVCPRGLIEARARRACSSCTRELPASAGSAPAASLKRIGDPDTDIRRLRPRPTSHPRGLPPRPH